MRAIMRAGVLLFAAMLYCTAESSVRAEPPLTAPPLLAPGLSPPIPAPAVSRAPIPASPTPAPTVVPSPLVVPNARKVPEPEPIVLRPTGEGNSPAVAESFQFGEELHELLNTIVRSNVPHTFTDEKKWGRTAEVWAGIKLRREGLKLETKRRKKTVNHGDWTRYEVKLLDPQEHLTVRFQNPVEKPGGIVAFDAYVSAPLRVHTRYVKWVHGVQLISISGDARATVALQVRCELKMRLDPTKLPPDVILEPRATDAQLGLLEFRLDSISKVGGAVANEIGDAGEGILRSKLEEYRPKLVEKINAAIAKRQDRLRISIQQMLESQWSDFAAGLDS